MKRVQTDDDDEEEEEEEEEKEKERRGNITITTKPLPVPPTGTKSSSIRSGNEFASVMYSVGPLQFVAMMGMPMLIASTCGRPQPCREKE
jgi:hypothetical protein